MENTPIVKLIRKYSTEPSGVFSISSLERILMAYFLSFHVTFGSVNSQFVSIIKVKLHLLHVQAIHELKLDLLKAIFFSLCS